MDVLHWDFGWEVGNTRIIGFLPGPRLASQKNGLSSLMEVMYQYLEEHK